MKDYDEYIDRYMAEVPEITFLSFDKYPIIKDPNVADSPRQILGEWYQCLEIVRDRALRSGMDFWSFMLTVPHTSYPQPTGGRPAPAGVQQPRLRHAGAPVLHLLDPDGRESRTLELPQRPVAEDGTRTETYDIVKSVLDETRSCRGSSWTTR